MTGKKLSRANRAKQELTKACDLLDDLIQKNLNGGSRKRAKARESLAGCRAAVQEIQALDLHEIEPETIEDEIEPETIEDEKESPDVA